MAGRLAVLPLLIANFQEYIVNPFTNIQHFPYANHLSFTNWKYFTLIIILSLFSNN